MLCTAREDRVDLVEIDDLGPANDTMFCLMSGLQVGDRLYIGSRNVEPSQVITFDIARREVVARHDLGPGKFVQALAVSPDARTLYAGIVGARDDEPNLFAIDLHGSDFTSGRPVASIPGLYVRALSVAPDGVVYAVGRHDRPGLWCYDPRTRQTTKVAELELGPTETRGVAATGSTVYFGSGSVLAGGAGASRSNVHAIDRDTGAVTAVQPAELDADSCVRDLMVVDGLLFIGTQGVDDRSHLAVVRIDAPQAVEVRTIAGKSVGCFHHADHHVYFGALDLWDYSIDARSLRTVTTADTTERWALGLAGESLLCVSAYGAVLYVDLATGAVDSVDLVAAGAPALPQLGMSLAADAETIFIAGNGGVVLRRPDDRSTDPRRLRVPGEAKSMQVVGGDLLLAVYNSGGVRRFRDGVLESVAALPVEQNRPQDTAWDAGRGTLLVVSENDTQGGGSLAAVDPTSGALRLMINPLDEQQMIRAVAVAGDGWFIGGWNRYPSGPRGEIAAIEPESLDLRWRTDPELGAGVSCIAAVGDQLVGISTEGGAFAMDRRDGRRTADRDLGRLVPGLSRMITVAGRTYVGSATSVFVIEPDLTVTVIADDLDGKWYSGSSIAADPAGHLYTLRGRRLVRLRTGERDVTREDR